MGIKSGSVEFCRTEDPVEDPALVFQTRSIKGSQAWASRSHAMLPYDRLSEGDIFCSLAVFPVRAQEPFTAVAKSSKCEVYYCEPPRFEGLPPEVLQEVRAHL